MIPPTAVLDSCVLYSAALRDLFMRAANAGLYTAKWTEKIHSEWIESILANRPDLTCEQLQRTRELMNAHAEGSLVEDYEGIIDTLTLPDADDRHVLAAAIVAEASVIVTFNLSDFPGSALSVYGIEAQHPDVSLCSLFDTAPDRFVDAVERLLAALRNPPRTLAEHVEVLRRQGLPCLAQRLSEYRKP